MDEQLVDSLQLHDARRVVVLGDLVEAELLVIVRADPFARVDRALLQRRIDIAARDLLRHDAELGHHPTAEAGRAHFEALEIGHRLELLAEPAEHLAAGLPAGQGHHAEAVVDLVHQLAAVAEQQPGVVLARREPEGQRSVEDHRRLLADVVAGVGLAAFHRRVGDGIEHLQAGNDLAGGKQGELELAVRKFAGDSGNRLGRPVQSVEVLGKARRQSPLDDLACLLGHCWGRCGRGQARCRNPSEMSA